MEIEHFIVWNKTGKSVTYFERDGIRDLLEWLALREWTPYREKGEILGLFRKKEEELQTVSLEPGAQLEFSTSPCGTIFEIEKEYLRFLKELTFWLKEKGQSIRHCGYHPVSSIYNIPLIPKKKYHLMDRFFRTTGKYAHHMMRGTGATQITLDFLGEGDFIRKLRTAAKCTPLLTMLFSNCPSFEGKPYAGHSIRTEIWSACDDERCGIIPGLFHPDFGYAMFADYVLSLKPIVYYHDGVYRESKEKNFQQMLADHPPGNFETTLFEMLRMIFTDVRVKQFIELRMADSLLPDTAVFYAALVKELFYNPSTFADIETLLEGIGEADIAEATAELPRMGFRTRFGGVELYEITEQVLKRAAVHPLSDTRNYLTSGMEFMMEKIKTNLVTAG